VRAYVLGYASSVIPRLMTLLLQYAAAKSKRNRRSTTPVKPVRPIAASVAHIFRTALELHRFPAFCAALVGGTSLLQLPIRKLIKQFQLAPASTRLRYANSPRRRTYLLCH
jgi:hypothetical protein